MHRQEVKRAPPFGMKKELHSLYNLMDAKHSTTFFVDVLHKKQSLKEKKVILEKHVKYQPWKTYKKHIITVSYWRRWSEQTQTRSKNNWKNRYKKEEYASTHIWAERNKKEHQEIAQRHIKGSSTQGNSNNTTIIVKSIHRWPNNLKKYVPVCFHFSLHKQVNTD